MCKCHELTKQCWPTSKKIEKKVMEERGFVLVRHETFHFSQWMQKHPMTHSQAPG
jgi:hypothetical protein